MKLHKMIEKCLKDVNMHIFVMINELICINIIVITCIISMLSDVNNPGWLVFSMLPTTFIEVFLYLLCSTLVVVDYVE